MATKLRIKSDAVRIMSIVSSNDEAFASFGVGSDGQMYGWSRAEGSWVELWDTKKKEPKKVEKPRRS